MRFIRRCLMAASYILVFLGSAQAQSVTIGSNAVWSGGNDSANGNLLSAQIAKLTQAATVQSLSFYVTAASGNLILGFTTPAAPKAGPARSKSRPPALPQRKGGIRPRWSRLSRCPPAATGWPFCRAAMLLGS